MNKIKLLFLTVLLAASCSIIKHTPSTETIIQYKDSTITNIIDSIVYIPRERIIDIVPIYDTLKLETSISKSITYVDTLMHVLKGELTNKNEIQYKYLYKDRIIYRDSLVVKEIKVPVEVEKKIHYKYEKYLWIYSVASFLLIILFLYKNISNSAWLRKMFQR